MPIQFSAPKKLDKWRDGVVMDIKALGLGDNSLAHEIGHYFNLYHPWGDDDYPAILDDFCKDTPQSTKEESFYRTKGLNFNLMTYVDDRVIFTKNQVERMETVLAPGGYREKLGERHYEDTPTQTSFDCTQIKPMAAGKIKYFGPRSFVNDKQNLGKRFILKIYALINEQTNQRSLNIQLSQEARPHQSLRTMASLHFSDGTAAKISFPSESYKTTRGTTELGLGEYMEGASTNGILPMTKELLDKLCNHRLIAIGMMRRGDFLAIPTEKGEILQNYLRCYKEKHGQNLPSNESFLVYPASVCEKMTSVKQDPVLGTEYVVIGTKKVAEFDEGLEEGFLSLQFVRKDNKTSQLVLMTKQNVLLKPGIIRPAKGDLIILRTKNNDIIQLTIDNTEERLPKNTKLGMGAYTKYSSTSEILLSSQVLSKLASSELVAMRIQGSQYKRDFLPRKGNDDFRPLAIFLAARCFANKFHNGNYSVNEYDKDSTDPPHGPIIFSSSDYNSDVIESDPTGNSQVSPSEVSPPQTKTQPSLPANASQPTTPPILTQATAPKTGNSWKTKVAANAPYISQAKVEILPISISSSCEECDKHKSQVEDVKKKLQEVVDNSTRWERKNATLSNSASIYELSISINKFTYTTKEVEDKEGKKSLKHRINTTISFELKDESGKIVSQNIKTTTSGPVNIFYASKQKTLEANLSSIEAIVQEVIYNSFPLVGTMHSIIDQTKKGVIKSISISTSSNLPPIKNLSFSIITKPHFESVNDLQKLIPIGTCKIQPALGNENVPCKIGKGGKKISEALSNKTPLILISNH